MVLKKIKKHLKKNIKNKTYFSSWKLKKRNDHYYYQDKSNNIKLNTKNIYSKGLLENLCLSIKIALDLKIKKNIIVKTLPKIKYMGRVEYLEKGKIKKKLHKNEKLLIDGCHSEISAKNLANYLKTLKIPIYGIWGMTKNKDPNNFIKQFKGIFEKVVSIPIENLTFIRVQIKYYLKFQKNNFNSEISKSFESALQMVRSKEKKVICVFG